jgi:hypothetical protein
LTPEQNRPTLIEDGQRGQGLTGMEADYGNRTPKSGTGGCLLRGLLGLYAVLGNLVGINIVVREFREYWRGVELRPMGLAVMLFNLAVLSLCVALPFSIVIFVKFKRTSARILVLLSMLLVLLTLPVSLMATYILERLIGFIISD